MKLSDPEAWLMHMLQSNPLDAIINTFPEAKTE